MSAPTAPRVLAEDLAAVADLLLGADELLLAARHVTVAAVLPASQARIDLSPVAKALLLREIALTRDEVGRALSRLNDTAAYCGVKLPARPDPVVDPEIATTGGPGYSTSPEVRPAPGSAVVAGPDDARDGSESARTLVTPVAGARAEGGACTPVLGAGTRNYTRGGEGGSRHANGAHNPVPIGVDVLYGFPPRGGQR